MSKIVQVSGNGEQLSCVVKPEASMLEAEG